MKIRNIAAVAAVVGSALVAPAAPASAAPIICSSNASIATITSQSRAPFITHVEALHLAPNTSYSQTNSIARTGTVAAGIDGTATVSGKANVIIGKADASVSATLHLSGSLTQQTSFSKTWTIGTHTSDRTYALFASTTRHYGSYNHRYCNSSGTGYTPYTSGPWQSWDVAGSGTALCPRSRYTSGTVQYAALVKIGC